MFICADRMPIFGETLIGSGFYLGPGGKGSNQAVGVARLGAESYFAGIIGDDKLGEVATDLYAKEGVHTQFLRKTSEMGTGVGFIVINPRGGNGIILDMSANKLMDPSFVDQIEEQISRSDTVMAVLEIPVEAAARAMELGRKNGVRTLLNPAPAQVLDEALLCQVDILTPNETELRILMGLAPDDPTPTPELARRLQKCGTKIIIVTMGEQGALVLTDSVEVLVPGIQVPVVDTTGAGDAFNAGLAVALAEGKDLIEAVKFANCSGAVTCTKLGVIEAMAHREQIDQLYRDHY
jgi:ribokinase